MLHEKQWKYEDVTHITLRRVRSAYIPGCDAAGLSPVQAKGINFVLPNIPYISTESGGCLMILPSPHPRYDTMHVWFTSIRIILKNTFCRHGGTWWELMEPHWFRTERHITQTTESGRNMISHSITKWYLTVNIVDDFLGSLDLKWERDGAISASSIPGNSSGYVLSIDYGERCASWTCGKLQMHWGKWINENTECKIIMANFKVELGNFVT